MTCNTSRRRFAVASLAAAIPTLSVLRSRTASAQSPKPESAATRSVDEWVTEWQARSATNKSLSGPLDLRRFKDPMYILLNPIAWRAGPGQTGGGGPVEVPPYFVSDFASVPRIFWSIFPTDGKYAYAAVLHDYVYWVQDRPRAEADKVFRLAMSDLKITDRQAATLYRAVDLFGASAWEGNAKLKAAGEKRVLVRLPTDPTTTWDEWRRQPGVFGG
ncbi:MAG: DUF1353 domain-containing protein [Comamonadaceae bacterium]|nr:MAG: DUF1353 domain-containing protein [Comamonadaceae bacterium]